jgi:predicted dienelactone hydrolase
MKHRLALWTVLALLFVLSFPIVLDAQDQPKPEAVGVRPDAPTYALHGPYWVGTQTLEVDAGTDNALRFTIWYPALNPDGLEESVTYQMGPNHALVSIYGFPPDAPFTVFGHALEGAAPDLSGAPYPLVINSHAFTAQMWQMYLGEHLASYGFVVIAPEHIHDSWDNVATSTVIRMLEVNRVIDDAATLTATDGLLPGMIDMDKIAVGGHGVGGGMTAYGAAGAPVLWTGLQDYCQTAPDDAECANLDGQFQEINQLLGTNAAVDELLPVIVDSRVDAIFPMAGSMELYDQKGLAAITIPMMALFGSADPWVDFMYPAYENVGSTQKSQVLFENAGNGIFYPQCAVFPYVEEFGFYWACSDAVWDLDRANDLTNHFVTAFLLDVLKGDADAHAALAPNAVSFPGITYEAQGF